MPSSWPWAECSLGGRRLVRSALLTRVRWPPVVRRAGERKCLRDCATVSGGGERERRRDEVVVCAAGAGQEGR